MNKVREMTSQQLGEYVHRNAVCVSATQLFIQPPGERSKDRPEREQAAAMFCAECPVTKGCLEYAARTTASNTRVVAGGYAVNGNKVYDIETGKLLSAARVAELRKNTKPA